MSIKSCLHLINKITIKKACLNRWSPDTRTHSCSTHIWVGSGGGGGREAGGCLDRREREEINGRQWEEGKSGPDMQAHRENCGLRQWVSRVVLSWDVYNVQTSGWRVGFAVPWWENRFKYSITAIWMQKTWGLGVCFSSHFRKQTISFSLRMPLSVEDNLLKIQSSWQNKEDFDLLHVVYKLVEKSFQTFWLSAPTQCLVTNLCIRMLELSSPILPTLLI